MNNIKSTQTPTLHDHWQFFPSLSRIDARIAIIALAVFAVAAAVVATYRWLQEQREHSALNRLQEIVEEEPNKESLIEFQKSYQNLMSLYTEEKVLEIAQKNIFRLNPSENPSRAHALKQLEGLQSDVILFHELIESLTLKWKHGVAFDRKLESWELFEQAHAVAVKAENFFLLNKAQNQGLALTMKGLTYYRPIDNYLHTPCSDRLKDDDIEYLTRNEANVPSAQEVEAYRQFLQQFGEEGKDRGRAMLQRFLFTKFYRDKRVCHNALYLFIEIFIQTDGITTDSAKKLEKGLNTCLDRWKSKLSKKPYLKTGFLDRDWKSSYQDIHRGDYEGVLVSELKQCLDQSLESV